MRYFYVVGPAADGHDVVERNEWFPMQPDEINDIQAGPYTDESDAWWKVGELDELWCQFMREYYADHSN